MHQYGAGTDVGNSRDNNEDSYVCDPETELWMVADGMGGLGFGEVASAITAHSVTALIRDGHGVNQAIEFAHKKIKEFAEREGMGANMGTTIVLLLSHGSLYNVFWVGDSRAYLFQDDTLTRLTVDHSVVQSLIDQGEITQLEAESDPRRNAVTRALGVQELETVRADSVSDKWLPKQKILLCSDGLTDCVSDDEIAQILRHEGTDQQKVDTLIDKALHQGGHDNITVIIVSAPESTRRPDSDTESPDERRKNNDVTRTASDDLTRQRDKPPGKGNDGIDKGAEPVPGADNFVEDNVSQRREDPVETSADPKISNPRDKSQSRWQKMLLTAAVIIAVAIFADLTTTSPQRNVDASSFPSTDVPPQTLQFEQVSRRTIPEFPARSGVSFQVGAFAALAGAESRQKELSQLGLTPWVRKRPTEDGVLYVVLLGPYDDDQRRQSVTEKLDANDLSYFQHPPRG